MYITQHTDYALRALIYLGTNEDRLVTIQEISERFAVSRNHLMKVVNALIRAGFVEGVRGKGRRPAAGAGTAPDRRRRRGAADGTRHGAGRMLRPGCQCILDPAAD